MVINYSIFFLNLIIIVEKNMVVMILCVKIAKRLVRLVLSNDRKMFENQKTYKRI